MAPKTKEQMEARLQHVQALEFRKRYHEAMAENQRLHMVIDVAFGVLGTIRRSIEADLESAATVSRMLEDIVKLKLK